VLGRVHRPGLPVLQEFSLRWGISSGRRRPAGDRGGFHPDLSLLDLQLTHGRALGLGCLRALSLASPPCWRQPLLRPFWISALSVVGHGDPSGPALAKHPSIPPQSGTEDFSGVLDHPRGNRGDSSGSDGPHSTTLELGRLGGQFDDLLKNMFLMQNYFRDSWDTGIGPVWSLAIELPFYLALPLLGLLAARMGGRFLGSRGRALVALLPRSLSDSWV
jgi:hypothetical protein